MTRMANLISRLWPHLISVIIHAVVLYVIYMSSFSWVVPHIESGTMLIDIIMPDNISVTASKPQSLMEGRDKGGQISESNRDVPVKGDTKLLSKDGQSYSKPIAALEKGDAEEIKKEGTKTMIDTTQQLPLVKPENALSNKDNEQPIPEEVIKPEKIHDPLQVPTVQDVKVTPVQERKPTEPQNKVAASPPPTKVKATTTPARAQKAASPIPQKRQSQPDEKMDKVLKAVKQYNQEARNAIAGKGNTTTQNSDSDARLAVHLAQYVQNQIVQCWNIPIAASDMDVKIHVKAILDSEGNVIDVTVMNKEQSSSPLYEALENSTVRAMKQCSPLAGLPADKHYLWSSLSLVFDTKKAR